MDRSKEIGFQFGYSFPRFTIPAGGTDAKTVTIDSDFNFVMDAIMGRIVENILPSPSVLADALIQFKDSTTTKDWFDRATLQQLILADARNINPPVYVRTVRKQSVVLLTVQNLEGFTIKIDMMLRGKKLDVNVPMINAQDSNRAGAQPAFLAESTLPTITPVKNRIGDYTDGELEIMRDAYFNPE